MVCILMTNPGTPLLLLDSIGHIALNQMNQAFTFCLGLDLVALFKGTCDQSPGIPCGTHGNIEHGMHGYHLVDVKERSSIERRGV